ncbi:MAG: hypothetical protein VX642_06075 [Bdellovibrionota bacterium]|nr:hypothetical protein [Bdellovibrionota bacterium]
MKFSEEAFIQINLLPLISVVVLMQMLCIYLLKQDMDKKEVQHLCWNQSLLFQSKIGNFYNYLEASYNPSAKAMNKTLLHLNRSIQSTKNIYAQAALRAAREALYLKQKSLHSVMRSKWTKSLAERELESKKLKIEISQKKYVKNVQQILELPSLKSFPQNPLARGFSPEYEIKNQSESNLKIFFDYQSILRVLQKVLKQDQRNIRLKFQWSCETEIIKWRNRWITKIKTEA